VVDGTLDLTELFNQLTRIYNKYDRWADSLQEILNTTADLNSIIVNSRYIFDNPIIIINANFQYLAHSEFSTSQVNELSIKSWGNADSTELPLDSFNAFLQNHEISTHVREPLLIKMFGTTTLNVNLFENGEYSGCVTIDYQHRPYRQSDDVLARYLGQTIEYALKKYSYATASEQSALRQALMNLLDGYQITLNQKRVIDTSYLQMQHICIRIKFHYSMRQLPISYFCNVLESDFRRSVAFEYDNSIVAFIEISDEQVADLSYLSLLQKKIAPIITTTEGSIGISDPFSDIYRGRLYYMQACAALENGRLFDPSICFYPFKKYILRELLINAVGDLPLEMYYTEGLRRLHEHDEVSPVSYLDTLKTYLDNNMNVTKTSADLYLNRSTLLERLARIKRELGSDLTDPNERLLFQILLYADKLHLMLHESK